MPQYLDYAGVKHLKTKIDEKINAKANQTEVDTLKTKTSTLETEVSTLKTGKLNKTSISFAAGVLTINIDG